MIYLFQFAFSFFFPVPLKHTVDTLIKKYDPVHSEGPSGRKKSPSVEDMTNK